MAYHLKSRQNPPPNGFLFVERHTNWSNWAIDPPTVWDFKLLCRAIRNHRLANPRFRLSTDLNQIADEVDFQNTQRLLKLPGATAQYLVSDAEAPPPPNPNSPPQSQEAVRSVGDALVRMASGVGVLYDWLGSGGQPVDNSVAEERARICSTCPKNVTGDLTRYFTVPAAALIQKMLDQRSEFKVSTSYDDKLHICAACGCVLKLKCHVPLDYLKAHMTEEVKAELDQRCWILHEP